MFKNFSKAVGCDANPDPDPWVRIRKKIHQNRKMQMIPDPDVVRIRESYQIKCECIWIRILESVFRNFYADPRFASDPYHTVRIPSSGSDWARTSLVCKGTRHLDHPWGAGNAMPCSRTNAIQVRQVPNLLKYHAYHYHLAVNSPEPTRRERASISVRLVGLGFFLRMTRCRG